MYNNRVFCNQKWTILHLQPQGVGEWDKCKWDRLSKTLGYILVQFLAPKAKNGLLHFSKEKPKNGPNFSWVKVWGMGIYGLPHRIRLDKKIILHYPTSLSDSWLILSRKKIFQNLDSP